MLDVVDRANDALRRGAWQDARTLYDHALQALETPEALEGLGEACWWLDDVVRVGEARERAYVLYRQRGDALGAARVALALAEDALIFRGEEAVMNGWAERARRLLAELDPAPEHALLAVHDAFFAFMLAGDMQVARRRAGEAVELARRFELFDLEMYARSIDGVAQVRQGHVAEGMRILDEATAAATSGEMRNRHIDRLHVLLHDLRLRMRARLSPRGAVVSARAGLQPAQGVGVATGCVPKSLRDGPGVRRRLGGSGG